MPNFEDMGPQMAGYDRAITVFSPQGRLYQVEYAREAVKKGTISLGISYRDGVILAVDKNITDPLMIANSVAKIYQIDEHAGAATSGLVADGRRLVDKARVDSQSHRLTYGEPISAENMCKKLTDYMQLYTQVGGLRPFGVALLLAGVNADGVTRLYETDPSGSYWEYKATAIGENSEKIKEILRKSYDSNMSKADAVDLALEALYKGSEEKFNSDSIEISIVDKKSRRYISLSDTQVQREIDRVLEKLKKK
ncbi:MAG: archaeal proteasome endopeptidase complex subunit alpha [archaeon]